MARANVIGSPDPTGFLAPLPAFRFGQAGSAYWPQHLDEDLLAALTSL